MAGKKPATTAETVPFTGFGSLYADKDEYLHKQLVFDVVGITFEEGQGFQGADRWVVEVEFPHDKRPNEKLTFSCNEKRDEEMEHAGEYLDKFKVIPDCTLVKSGRAYYIRSKGGD